MSTDPQLLTVQEVADYLRVTPETIKRAIRQKKLKALKFGGRTGYRIKQQDLKDYEESLSKRPAA